MKIAQIVGAAGLVVLVFSLSACSRQSADAGASTPAAGQPAPSAAQSSPTGSAQRPQSISAVLTRTENVPVTLSAQGNVQPLDEVDIRPQKTGTVSQIHFKEGEEIKRGQLLFSIDNREDLANLRKAEATLTGTQAQLTIAQRQLERNQDLFNKSFVSSAALDTSRNQIETLQSQLEQNRASVEQLRTVLSYSSIKAPFNGRAGRIDVRPGSLVLANTSISMVKITRMDPIAVSFNLPERDLGRLRDAMNQGPVSVRVNVPGQKGDEVRGKVIFVDNSIDKVSGTIAVKAQVDNAQRKLWPGQYVVVRINAGEIADAVVLPPQAIVNGPTERFVYLVMPDSTVKQQAVEVVRISGQNAIVKGIAAGVKVVLEGAANLRPGGKVIEVAANNGNGGGRNGGRNRGGNAAASAPVAQSEAGDGAKRAQAESSPQ